MTAGEESGRARRFGNTLDNGCRHLNLLPYYKFYKSKTAVADVDDHM